MWAQGFGARPGDGGLFLCTPRDEVAAKKVMEGAEGEAGKTVMKMSDASSDQRFCAASNKNLINVD